MAHPCVSEIERREIACDPLVAYLRKYEYDIVLPHQLVEDVRVQEMADDDVVVYKNDYLRHEGVSAFQAGAIKIIAPARGFKHDAEHLVDRAFNLDLS
jgi:hypothetical protein